MAANHPPRDTTQTAGTGAYLRRQLEAALLAPIRALRWNYLPLLMVYFAYGALGIVAIAQSFWVKSALTMTPADLAALSVWLALPWAVKMVFGELVDSVPVLGSQRRVYVFIGAALVAAGLLMLAGVAGGAITFAKPDTVYVIASLLSVTGVVLQDVVADAMSTEVVSRTNADGTPRPPADVDRDLGMVQVLGRLALSAGIFSVAGLSGYLAQTYSYQTVFLIGLIVPVISVSGALLVKLETSERRAIDWRILGGGIAFGLLVTAAQRRRRTVCPRDRVRAVDGGHHRHAEARHRTDLRRRPAPHHVCRHHHLCVPGHAIAGRRLPLVHHRRAGLR